MRTSFEPAGKHRSSRVTKLGRATSLTGGPIVAQSAAVDVHGDLPARGGSKRVYSSRPAGSGWRARLTADGHTRTWLQLGVGVLVQVVALVLIFAS
jgi:hypothetical protein